jgi:hypothetical protein
VNVVPLVESPLGSGSYAATIPPQEPIHGPVDIQSSIVCPPQSSVSPDSGTAAGGNTVVLTGSGFTGVTGVSFGGISAESFTVAADGAIEAVAPAGTGTVPVTVSVGASTTVVGQYTYVAITSGFAGSRAVRRRHPRGDHGDRTRVSNSRLFRY